MHMYIHVIHCSPLASMCVHIHMFWLCPCLHTFWTEVFHTLSQILNVDLELDALFALFVITGDGMQLTAEKRCDLLLLPSWLRVLFC